MKEAANRIGFGETVAVEGPGSDALIRRAASLCETSPLSNHPNAGAYRFLRGAHHRRCAREGLTEPMMPHVQYKLQACELRYLSDKEYIPDRQYILDVIHDTHGQIMIVTRLDKLLAKEKRSFYWLAKQTGVSHTTLWRLKKGKAVGINFETLEKICRALRCQTGDVLFFVNQRVPPKR
jgi:putative transcriptional regulator